MKIEIGVIGGSGLYGMDGIDIVEERQVDTPFGATSGPIIIGTMGGVPLAFLARHGQGHTQAPHELPYRANIWALNSLGVKWLLSFSAVGSMREEIAPGDFVLVDQFIDRTHARPVTFFEDGIVGHVSLADPVCTHLHGALVAACEEVDVKTHARGTYICIQGPQFSTRAESRLFRSWDVSVIGMTGMTEARLAREAQMGYAIAAMSTDYDCWFDEADDVSVDAVVAVMKGNATRAQAVLRAVVPKIGSLPNSQAFNALEHAIMTTPDQISDAVRTRLAPLL